ncbi:MarR family transcriptional regulator [Evansella sp. AB-P1]|uniref:MarR family winged helix-turn-helix transcriptional regulator n=1 Tax=Evansella sp. AB-P1 TaxID=3037653 RepID=UPI00241F856C|nr:MarR family transcriptional regulator [Evansella sp. AB-P1]MDG5788367.1 MarR family transcriptional regulator [Evansella sp. AB-P1]
MNTNNKIEDIANFYLTFFPVLKKKILPPIENAHKKEISPTHFWILLLLEECGKLPTTEIGKRLLILKSNLTPLINKLLSKGFVSRENAQHDRRIIYILLTDEGREYIQQEMNYLHGEIKKRFVDLDDKDIHKLHESIKNMSEVIAKL